MQTGFDRVVVEVPELATAVADYTPLFDALGAEGRALDNGHGFVLRNTVIELREAACDAARIAGLVLSDDTAPAQPEGLAEMGSIWLQHCDGQETDALRSAAKFTAPEVAVDHVVLRTRSADDCIALFGEQLGVRLALDQTVEKWGGRMLFFRSGKMTLEVIDAEKERPEQDFFWGVAYQCPGLDAAVARLEAAGVQVSSVRDGRKPGTRVATLKSADLGIPTLLIEPAT